ncbi:MAG: hypothetical protein HOP29_14370 [Phycisphaerales bacterium]|nr:hypothetical protein [Phycisphaerales bacterium]
MIRFACDRCGVALKSNDSARFILKIEAYASAGPLAFDREEIERDRSAEMEALIEQLKRTDADQIEDQTYRAMRFDLCRECHREFLADPIGRRHHDGRHDREDES